MLPIPWAPGSALHLPMRHLDTTVLCLIKQTSPASQMRCRLGVLDPRPFGGFCAKVQCKLPSLALWIVCTCCSVYAVTCAGVTHRTLSSCG